MNAPIFIIGRQHSGNTMLTSMLGRHPELLGMEGEGAFFEHRSHLQSLSPDVQVERVADFIWARLGGENDRSLRDRLETVLRQRISDQPSSTSPIVLYRTGMRWLAEQHRAVRWVQKATSYVFYIEDIIRAFPDARMLFLARNPLDLAASLKRRGEWRRVLRMVWGWNRGTKAARRWAANESSHLLLVRYEDLVRRPRTTTQAICAFIDLVFDDTLLSVPHLNRSETPYNQQSASTGVNASRVHYYRDVLSPQEEAIVRTWLDPDLLSYLYADLPGARSCGMRTWALAMVQSMGSSAQNLLADHASALVSEPRHAFDRIRRRIA